VKKLGATMGHQAMVLSQPTSNKDTARGGVVAEPASVGCIRATGVELLAGIQLPAPSIPAPSSCTKVAKSAATRYHKVEAGAILSVRLASPMGRLDGLAELGSEWCGLNLVQVSDMRILSRGHKC